MHGKASYRLTEGVFAHRHFDMSQDNKPGLTWHGCNVGVAGFKKTLNCCLDWSTHPLLRKKMFKKNKTSGASVVNVSFAC